MKHILIVDDDKTNLASAKAVLSDLYKVTLVTSGSMAFRFLENNSCDLILLDINMPDMNGFEVMKAIKCNEAWKNIPIIFLTADNDAETESSCLEAGALDFIVKPFVTTVMRSRIARILELDEMRKTLADRLEKTMNEVSEIKNKSQHDVLTGLWNRAYTENEVNNHLMKNARGTVLMMDMDNFKAINDNYGHLEGDRVLKMFADTMRDHSGDDDILCRIGGDEFIMFIEDEVTADELKKLASDIIEDMSGKIKENGYETGTSVSIGISQFPNDGRDFSKLYNSADKALYYVKQNGKKSFHFFGEQRETENSRAANLIDLKYLSEVMFRADTGKGAYQLNLDSFQHVYNFIHRLSQRSGQMAQIVLYTLVSKDGSIVETQEGENALELMENAIYTSIRRNDVSTRYSSKQLIVVLMDTDPVNGSNTAQRILDCFHKMDTRGKLDFEFGIAQMER